jgi:hypothetical protein
VNDDPFDYDAICPGCGKAIGEHSIREYGDCLKKAGFDYELPYEDAAGGPFQLPGEGALVGEVSVAACVLTTAMGPVPALRFIFIGAGPNPMERRQMDPITLVMSDSGLEAVARLVRNAAKRASQAARKAAA